MDHEWQSHHEGKISEIKLLKLRGLNDIFHLIDLKKYSGLSSVAIEVRKQGLMQGHKSQDYAHHLGKWGVMKLVWHAIPWQFRLFVYPYYLPVYIRILAQCASADEVKRMHLDRCHRSRVFRMFRPRYHIFHRALLPLDVKFEDNPSVSV